MGEAYICRRGGISGGENEATLTAAKRLDYSTYTEGTASKQATVIWKNLDTVNKKYLLMAIMKSLRDTTEYAYNVLIANGTYNVLRDEYLEKYDSAVATITRTQTQLTLKSTYANYAVTDPKYALIEIEIA